MELQIAATKFSGSGGRASGIGAPDDLDLFGDDFVDAKFHSGDPLIFVFLAPAVRLEFSTEI
jgi:hypothetical protein